MLSLTRHCVALLVLLTLTACSALGTLERPDVNIISVRLAPQTAGSTPRFDIGIQIINPNSRALPLRGMSYALEIEGQRILSGAKPDLPQIPAFGSAEFVIQAIPDLIGSARLIGDLLSRQRDSLAFTFSATLDPGPLMPNIRITESGRFDLDNRTP